ncbi:MAG: hypothetical protein ACOCRK_01540 [bacterium]
MNLKKESNKLNDAIDDFEKKFKDKVQKSFTCKDIDIDFFKLTGEITIKKDGKILTKYKVRKDAESAVMSGGEVRNVLRTELIKGLEKKIEEMQDTLQEFKNYTLYEK